MNRTALATTGLVIALSGQACTPMDAKPEPVLAGAGQPTHIAADLSHVYIATSDKTGSTITRVDKERWDKEKVTTVRSTIRQLDLFNDAIYWLVDHPKSDSPVVAIQKAERKANAAAEDLVKTLQPITSFAWDATHLYWAQAGDPNDPDEVRSQGILRAMDPRSTPTNVVTRLQGEPHNITLGGGHVYWVTKERDGGSAVMSWPKMGGAPIELLMFHRSDVDGMLPALAEADAGVYVLTRRELVLIAAEGKQSKRIKHAFAAPKPELVFDFKNLYFRTNGGLMKLSPDNGEFLPIAPEGTGTFAVDASFVYWAQGGEVLKKEK